MKLDKEKEDTNKMSAIVFAVRCSNLKIYTFQCPHWIPLKLDELRVKHCGLGNILIAIQDIFIQSVFK